jgi:hypothetical protein
MTRLGAALLALYALLASSSAGAAQPEPGAFTVGLLLPAGATEDWALIFGKNLRELGHEQGRILTLAGLLRNRRSVSVTGRRESTPQANEKPEFAVAKWQPACAAKATRR